MSTKQITFEKFTQDQWNKIEQRFEQIMPHDKYVHINSVLNAMCLLADDKSVLEEANLRIKTCGNPLYLELIRPELVKLKLVSKMVPYYEEATETETNSKKNDKYKKSKNRGRGRKRKSAPKMTKEEIRAQNTKNKLKKVVKETLSTFSYKKLNNSYGFNSVYAELRLATLMYTVNYTMNACFDDDQFEEQCYELNLGVKKILNNIKSMEGISSITLLDLEKINSKLSQNCKFRNEVMFKKYPRLPLFTKYDNVFPSLSIKPYPSQVNLMKTLKNNPSLLSFYNATIGSGKTTFSIALIKYVEMMRRSQKANKRAATTQVIFACSVEPVRHQVCLMAYNKNIPFGIGVIQDYSEKKNTLRIINNYNCKTNTDRLLIVADLRSTIEILKKSQDYVLFLDEPTVGADQENHPITDAVAQILTLVPKQTILSSATLPEANEIRGVIDYFQKRHESSSFHSVCSKESIIGCEIISLDGETLTPQTGIKTAEELKYVINQLRNKLFIDRLYTAPIVYRLNKILKSYDLSIDLEKYFVDVNKLSQKEIQQVAIKLLEIISNQSDEIVEEICRQVVDFKRKSYDINNLLTTEAHRFLGQTLVTTEDPMEFAKSLSNNFLKDFSATKLVKKYEMELAKYKTELHKLEYIKDEDKRSQLEQEATASEPKIKFPSYLQINSHKHLKKYAPDYDYDISLMQTPKNLESLPLKANIPDWVLLLLFCGVGIYTPYDDKLDKTYTDAVLNLAANGKLSFLIADGSISYGANYPFSHVIIMDDLAKHHSISTIFQLAGRAGRVGQSWVAFVHVGQETAKRILNYIKGDESTGISAEAVNLMKSFDNCINPKQKKEKSDTATIKSKKVVFIPSTKIVSMKDLRKKMGIKPAHVPTFDLKPKPDQYVPPCIKNNSMHNIRSRDKLQTLQRNQNKRDQRYYQNNHRDQRDYRGQRDHRDQRDYRGQRDHRDQRDYRGQRDHIDYQGQRDQRDQRDYRGQSDYRDYRGQSDHRDHRDQRYGHYTRTLDSRYKKYDRNVKNDRWNRSNNRNTYDKPSEQSNQQHYADNNTSKWTTVEKKKKRSKQSSGWRVNDKNTVCAPQFKRHGQESLPDDSKETPKRGHRISNSNRGLFRPRYSTRSNNKY